MSALFAAKDLTKSYGKVRALDSVSFDMLSSDVMAIIGKNGSGKSTLFDLVTGKLKPDSGKVFYKDKDITGLSPQNLFKIGIGCTHQRPAIFTSLTAMENVQISIFSSERRAGAMFEGAKALFAEDALNTLDTFGIADQANTVAGQLPIAEQKRLEIAMVMAHYPRMLIMDEPTAGLPSVERSGFMELCMETALRNGAALFFLERDLDMVFHFAGRVLAMNHGVIVADGTPSEMRDSAAVRDLYLGYSFENLEIANAQTIRH